MNLLADDFERRLAEVHENIINAEFTEIQKAHNSLPARSTLNPQSEATMLLADPYVDLRRFARDKLKGQERAVIEALCEAGGEITIANLAISHGVDWNDPMQGFKDVQRRLKKKLKSEGWQLQRQDNSGRLVNINGA